MIDWLTLVWESGKGLTILVSQISQFYEFILPLLVVDWLTLVSEIGKVSKKLDDNPHQKVFTILVSLDSSIFQIRSSSFSG